MLLYLIDGFFICALGSSRGRGREQDKLYPGVWTRQGVLH